MRLRGLWSTRTALVAAFVAFSSVPAGTQAPHVLSRITQPVDTRSVVRLRGNTHPMARPESDRGVAPDSLPMARMLLVLQRGPEEEGALRQLLDDQQVKSSP